MTYPECSKCGKRRGKGQVKDGVFTCQPCINLERKTQAAGQTRYEIVTQKGGLRLVTAVYNETAKRFNKLRYEEGWPYYEEFVLKKYSWSGPPGGASPQEALDRLIRSKDKRRSDYREALARAQEELDALRQFAQEQGLEFPEEEHGANGPPPDPSCIDPTD